MVVDDKWKLWEWVGNRSLEGRNTTLETSKNGSLKHTYTRENNEASLKKKRKIQK